jgi:hypothetical protein
MRLAYYLFAILFEVACIQSAAAQVLTKINPGLSAVSEGLSAGEKLSVLSAKPQIPYLEELRQIQSLKRSYDSLRNELARVRESVDDSARQDSLLTLMSDRSRGVLEKETHTLESLIASDDIHGEEVKNAAIRTLEGVRGSQTELSEISELTELESLIDRNSENLKALTNEWLMPKVEEAMTGKVGELADPGKIQFSDFYGKDALEQLTREGVPADLSFEQAKSAVREKALHLSAEYVTGLKGKFSKLKFDSLGNIEVIQEVVTEQKFKLLEENELRDASFFERLGTYIWYDPLTSFGEGFYGEAGISYRFSQQMLAFGGALVRRNFSEGMELTRTGQGATVGFRFSKDNWFVQSQLAMSNVEIDYPAGFENRDFEGEVWSAGVGIGRVVPLGKRTQSLVFATWDPTYSESKSLSNSPFQLKIGFELNGFKGVKGMLSEGVDRQKVKRK